MPLTNYTFSGSKDVYTITNTGLLSIDYDVEVLSGCYTYESILTGSIPVGESVDIDLSIRQDGTYNFQLTDGVDTATETVTKFSYLLTNFINEVEQLLCNCGCEANTECCNGLNTLIKGVSLMNFLADDEYREVLKDNYLALACLMTEETYCMLNTERMTNNTFADSLLLKTVAVYYLSFYFTDYALATTDEERTIVDNTYKITKIFPCIRKLGINIENLSI